MSTENDPIQTPPQTPAESAPPPAAPGPGLDLGRVLFKIINDVEHLRLMFNNIATARDDAFLNLVVNRLVSNDEFHKRLAEAMYAKAAEVMREGKGGANANRPIEGSGEHVHHDVTPVPTASITAGFYDFEGNQGYVEIALNETGEGVAGGRIYPNTGEDPRVMDRENEWDNHVITAIDQSYRHLTTHEPITNVNNGDKFWYRVEMYNPRAEQPVEAATGSTLA